MRVIFFICLLTFLFFSFFGLLSTCCVDTLFSLKQREDLLNTKDRMLSITRFPKALENSAIC